MNLNYGICLIICELLCTLTLGVKGLQELYVYHAPSHMTFSTNNDAKDVLKGSEVPNVASAVLGFSTKETVAWNGLKSGSPLERPKSVMIVELDGFSDINLGLDGSRYPLLVDVPPGWSYQIVADRIFKRFPDRDLTLLHITNDDTLYTVKSQYYDLLLDVPAEPMEQEQKLFSESSVLKNVQLNSLNTSLTPDLAFFLDMQLLRDLGEALKSNAKRLKSDPSVNLFWLESAAMQGLVSVYGVKSPQVTEAVAIVRDVLTRLRNTMTKVYEDNFLMLVLTVDYQNEATKSRMSRSILQESTATNSSANIAPSYSQDYPAIFNIIFFTMLIISLSLFGIALAMWHMDPGRDSIIYRMTSQRIKKDQ